MHLPSWRRAASEDIMDSPNDEWGASWSRVSAERTNIVANHRLRELYTHKTSLQMIFMVEKRHQM
jgi:hypothetical protein